MGSEMGHVSMYYTEEEPPIDFIGKKRHFFGKPSIKGMATVKNTQMELTTGNGPKDEAAIKAMQILVNSPKDLRGQLESQFRNLDHNQQGILRKDDFVNILFDVTRNTLQPIQVMSIVQSFVATLETAVNYFEFLKMLDRTKADSFSQDEAGPHLINAMRDQIHARIQSMSHHDREVIEKLRKISKNAGN